MAQVINTNSLSLLTQNNLNKSQSTLSSAIERLSSGLRINSAKDDAAGQAIANRFSSNIRGLTQASRNANDGISIAQTTEGSLSEINNNLQRVRELSVQASNGTNSDSDLESIQAEIKQRLDEIDRVSGQTQFNGVKVLASEQTLKIQIGANDGETIDINLKEITSKTLGLDKLDLTNQVSSKGLDPVGSNIKDAVLPQTVPATKLALKFPTATANPVTKVLNDGSLAVQVGSDYYSASYDSATNTIAFDSSKAAIVTPVDGNQDSYVDANGDIISQAKLAGATLKDGNTTPAPSFEVYRKDDTGAYLVKVGSDTYSGASIDLANGTVTLGAKDATAVATTGYTKASTNNVLDVPGKTTVGQAAIAVDMTDVNSALKGKNELLSRDVKDDAGKTTTQYFIKNTGDDGKVSYYNATADLDAASPTAGKVSVGSKAMVDPLSAIDDALAQVDSLRSGLGAVQNRFDSTITNLGNTVNNLSSARSRIEDADYATEVSNMSKAQILQQAGTSVLAQANQVTQNVLSLLR
ncbi:MULTISPECIES: flagellin [unclassified Citrobacter]|uniref:flagellin N-terminal helical domain-containing protein n=1 Tax=unclassified Citrobacter TaxID=2644389 RepID=UPI00129B15C6|nr:MULTISPECIES: flagellin [unclassified Citrobacter]